MKSLGGGSRLLNGAGVKRHGGSCHFLVNLCSFEVNYYFFFLNIDYISSALNSKS